MIQTKWPLVTILFIIMLTCSLAVQGQVVVDRAQGVSRQFKKSHQENEARIQAVISAHQDALVQGGIVASIEEVQSVSEKTKKRFLAGRSRADDLFTSNYKLKSGAKSFGSVEPVGNIRFEKVQSGKGYFVRAVGSFKVKKIPVREAVPTTSRGQFDRWEQYAEADELTSVTVFRTGGDYLGGMLDRFTREQGKQVFRDFGLDNNYQVDFTLRKRSEEHHLLFRFQMNFKEFLIELDDKAAKLWVGNSKKLGIVKSSEKVTKGKFLLGAKLKVSVRVINHMHYVFVNEKFIGAFDNLADADSELIGFRFWQESEKYDIVGYSFKKVFPYHHGAGFTALRFDQYWDGTEYRLPKEPIRIGSFSKHEGATIAAEVEVSNGHCDIWAGERNLLRILQDQEKARKSIGEIYIGGGKAYKEVVSGKSIQLRILNREGNLYVALNDLLVHTIELKQKQGLELSISGETYKQKGKRERKPFVRVFNTEFLEDASIRKSRMK